MKFGRHKIRKSISAWFDWEIHKVRPLMHCFPIMTYSYTNYVHPSMYTLMCIYIWLVEDQPLRYTCTTIFSQEHVQPRKIQSLHVFTKTGAGAFHKSQ